LLAAAQLFPPAPGVVPFALASMTPEIVAVPWTARITGLLPVSVNVLPGSSVRLRNARMSMLCPPACATLE
jgi:hypothetical protein